MINQAYKLHLATAMAIIGLFSGSAFGDTIEIDSCGTIINEPGRYKVVTDLDCSDSDYLFAIKILSVSEVDLDLEGYTISGTPNVAYGGSGNGIHIFNASQIKIDGSDNDTVLQHFANAIRISRSEDVEIDGDSMYLRDNSHGIIVDNSQDIEVRQIRFRNNVQRDIFIYSSADVDIKSVKMPGPSRHAVLASDSQRVEIENLEAGYIDDIQRGVIFYDTSDSVLKNSEIDRAASAVLLQGANTFNVVLERNEFGQQSPNLCDVEIRYGAAEPQLENNDPNTPLFCSP